MLKLTLRELLMLLAIIGLVLGWLVDHREQLEAQKAQVKLQRVSDQQFESLVGLLHGEGFRLECDSGGWPVRFVQAPIISPQPFNRRHTRGIDCSEELDQGGESLPR